MRGSAIWSVNSVLHADVLGAMVGDARRQTKTRGRWASVRPDALSASVSAHVTRYSDHAIATEQNVI
jgi:hypothetical protein